MIHAAIVYGLGVVTGVFVTVIIIAAAVKSGRMLFQEDQQNGGEL
jgi:hypothetical protein